MNDERQAIRTLNYWAIISVVLSTSLFSIVVPSQTPIRRNGKIAFSSDRDGNREIYVMDADGTNQVRLTNNNVVDGHPAWSPNGKKIAYLSQRPSGNFAVFQMDADGSGKTEVTPVSYPSEHVYYGWSISWSPDGDQLVFQDAQGIYIVNSDGSGRRFLVNGYGPAWSPDGSKILFLSGFLPSSLNTIRPDGTERQTLPPLPDFFNWHYDASWSPAGEKIVIVAFDGANEVIFLADADGTDAVEFHYECVQSPRGCSRLAMPDWSPDGRSIVFFAWGFEVGREIYVKDIAEGTSRRLTDTAGNNSDPSWQPILKSAFDFDGDGRADIAVRRPSDGIWYLQRSSAGFTAVAFGVPGDLLAPADYDGDGKSDIAVFRPSENRWYIAGSVSGFYQVNWGIAGDIPVPADYDGDGIDDVAIYRPSQGTWYIVASTAGIIVNHFGISEDRPHPADYDGDGRVDLAVRRPSNNTWYLQRTTAAFTAVAWGETGDLSAPADYDGDGKADLAVFRPSTGTWFVFGTTRGIYTQTWGQAGDIPVAADYDGDAKADVAVFRPSNGTWYIIGSRDGIMITTFGQQGDVAAPSVFNY